ncbi:MAG: hypothetical protein KDB48_07005 [Solirubrobacterales bacterium]|nr:hypothetical protein [Solirubrobacterales bacterium]HMT04483.1 PfkB family carbohydrate kinase [Solirubrobacterales bacterium]
MVADRKPQSQIPGDRPIACFGEAITDLICERNLMAGETADCYVPHPGGALANVAVAVARAGVSVALVGGVGDDRWGSWLGETLESEGVSTKWLARLERAETPVAVVEFGPDNEPSFRVYGEQIGPTMAATSGFLHEAVTGSSALIVGSNTMVGETEREVTRRAIELARDRGRPVLLDPNYRPNRWAKVETAIEFCRELTGVSDVIKLNRTEAELITGNSDLLTAARDLVTLGPALAVVTDGTGTVFTAGAIEEVHHPEQVPTVSPLGAGDAFMGGLAAGLARRGWDLELVGEVLPEAVGSAAAAVRGWGAQ